MINCLKGISGECFPFSVNPIQDGGGKAPYQFSTVTSANVRIRKIRLKNILTFSFNLFVALVQNFKAITNTSPKLSNLNQDHPSKNRFFRSNRSFIEMLELQNFGHMIPSYNIT